MDVDFYLQRALARRGIDRWYYDHQQRTASNLKLLEEYLSRLCLWMERLNMPFERWWRASDLADALAPHIRTSAEIHQWAFQLLEKRPYPYGVDELTFENMLRWETLKQKHPEIVRHYDLPDPYEPFILLLRRGGGFYLGTEKKWHSYENENTLHLTAGNLSLLSREVRWLTHDIQHLSAPDVPIVSLDEKTLDAIDASTPKLYGFFPDGSSNVCGQTRNGDQYLLYDHLYVNKVILMLKFSRYGELMEITEKERKHDPTHDLNVIAAELGILEMQITVQKFFLPQYNFGIKDLPDSYEDFPADPSAFDEDEHEELEERIEDWLIEASFVLELGNGNDYWLSIEGYVTAT